MAGSGGRKSEQCRSATPGDGTAATGLCHVCLVDSVQLGSTVCVRCGLRAVALSLGMKLIPLQPIQGKSKVGS